MTMILPATEERDEEVTDILPDEIDGIEPMDVAAVPAEGITTVEDQKQEDSPSGSHEWIIRDVTRTSTKKLFSDTFTIGGHPWRILLFPRGNNVDYLSIYLDVADSITRPPGWSKTAHFTLTVVNQLDPSRSIKKDCTHQFTTRENDWGFSTYMSLNELYDPSLGFVLNDTLIVSADVNIRSEDWMYDSKKATGFVGLKNQGATCYMNSLLQTLYHLPSFRKAVYHMPTTEDDLPSKSIPLALQSLFFKLQYRDTCVSTKDLTKSFGWDTYDSFMQHDVQELNRVLCEKLEDKMKGTVVEGTIERLFEGHHMNYIECINVDYKSTRKESFYDLQLDVKNCKNVYDSFDKYVEVERLDGENKYHAEQHGLQDAKKGVLFIDFPPVLQLQLKRFEYDFMRDTMVKINDRYEFPLDLDLDRENRKYLSPDSDKSVENKYTLHSVLVHSGGVHGGHYYAYIRPDLGKQWYKFDDERVTKEDEKRALDEQYGGEEEVRRKLPSMLTPGFNTTPFRFTKYSNAYMLVYIRVSDIPTIVCKVTENDVAQHLQLQLKKEQEEKDIKKKDKLESHLYVNVKVAWDEDLKQQIGKGGMYFDLADHSKVTNFRILKSSPFLDFKKQVEKAFGVPLASQRFWLWAKRQNHTLRLNKPLTALEEAMQMGQLADSAQDTKLKSMSADLKLFLECNPPSPDGTFPPLPKYTQNVDFMLFFKLYDAEKEELRYVGRLVVKADSKPSEIKKKLCMMAGLPPGEDIAFYEEVKFEPSVMVEPIDVKVSFKANQLEDGDIICFQKASHLRSSVRFPAVSSFLEYVRNRQVVHFRLLEKPKEDSCVIELSKLNTYDEVVGQLARKVGVADPTLLRLTAHNCYAQTPKPTPIKYRGVERLTEMLVHYQQVSDILYYEILDIPLPQLQTLKTLRVAFHNSKTEEESVHNLRLPKQSTVGDVVKELRKKVQLSSETADMRIMEVYGSKIFKVISATEPIEGINDQYWSLRAEEIPEEESKMGPDRRLIHVVHFSKDSSGQLLLNFGEPFLLCVRGDETLGEAKQRIMEKLQINAEEFEKWKFAFVTLVGKPEYLQDSDVLSKFFTRKDSMGICEHNLGLEHVDNTPKRHTASQNRYSYEKPVKIHN